MDPKDLPEEHRKYLDMSDNPKRPTNTSIFALVSNGLTEIKVALGKVETRQEQMQTDICKVDKNLEKLDDTLNNKIEILDDDFKSCQMRGIGIRGSNEEKFVWIMRAIKLIIIMSTGTLAFLFYQMGLPFFFP